MLSTELSTEQQLDQHPVLNFEQGPSIVLLFANLLLSPGLTTAACL